MADPAITPPNPILAGMTGRCPRCGKGSLFAGFLGQKSGCEYCALDYSFVDTGDGPAVFVVMISGFIVVGAALAVEMLYAPPFWVHAVLWVPLVIITAVLPLRPVKGILIALQYHHKAAEGRGRAPRQIVREAPSRRGLLMPSIAAACAFAILIGLGVWQVKRLAWKDALIATVSERFAAPPTALPPPSEWAHLNPADDEFRRVRVSAEFLNDKTALVFTTGSSLRAGDLGPGYWVFTPARFSDGTVMVNRGFVPEGRQDPARLHAGEIAGSVDMVGVMRWPERPGVFTPEAEPAKNLFFARDSTAIAAAKDIGPVAPFYIELESPAAPGGFPVAASLQPSFPNNHLGYAVTWFGLAAVLAASFAFWAVGRGRQA